LDDNMSAKVADFGLAKFRDGDENSNTMGSVAWMAPEIIENASTFSLASDVYSFAMCMWEMVTGLSPLEELTPISFARKVLEEEHRPHIPETCPHFWRDLITICWNAQPHMRPTFSQILDMLVGVNVKRLQREVARATKKEESPSPQPLSSRTSSSTQFDLNKSAPLVLISRDTDIILVGDPPFSQQPPEFSRKMRSKSQVHHVVTFREKPSSNTLSDLSASPSSRLTGSEQLESPILQRRMKHKSEPRDREKRDKIKIDIGQGVEGSITGSSTPRHFRTKSTKKEARLSRKSTDKGSVNICKSTPSLLSKKLHDASPRPSSSDSSILVTPGSL